MPNRTGAKLLALTLMLATLGLGACGDDDGDDDQAETTPGIEGEAPAAEEEEIVIETEITFSPDRGGTGEILDGSSIGDSEFCPDGTFRDRDGNATWLLEKVIDCPDGDLTIGFSPGQPVGGAQTGPWKVLSGTDAYEELRAEGRMEVTFESVDADEGNETFTGTVIP